MDRLHRPSVQRADIIAIAIAEAGAPPLRDCRPRAHRTPTRRTAAAHRRLIDERRDALQDPDSPHANRGLSRHCAAHGHLPEQSTSSPKGFPSHACFESEPQGGGHPTDDGGCSAVCLFLAALWILDREISGIHFADVMTRLRELPWISVTLSLGYMLASYLALAGYDWLALRHIGRRLPSPTCFRAPSSQPRSDSTWAWRCSRAAPSAIACTARRACRQRRSPR